MQTYIPNYGLVLILFSVMVKILVYPLTKKSYESTAAMQELAPELTSIKEKYKNNPQKVNEATMKLYKERGVNPLGGCLPMLLQMPLLLALFQVFRSTIELRADLLFLDKRPLCTRYEFLSSVHNRSTVRRWRFSP